MDRPKLRKVDRFEHRREGQDLLVVRDPLGLAEPFALEVELAPVLDLLDGTRTLPQIRQSLLMGAGLDLPLPDLQDFVAQLREQGLCDDDSFRERWAELHTDFLEAPQRPPTLAGLVYPATPHALATELERAIPSVPSRTRPDGTVIGVLAPHGPIAQVGPLLDETLRGLPAPDRLEHIVLLGTDHGPGLLPYAVTAKPYATPLGALPPAIDLIDALERRVPWIRREELRHRNAISLELAAVFLLHFYGERCPPVIPVLCGATGLMDPEQRDQRERFELALGGLCEDRPVLWWLSAELSHAGPAYGRPPLRPTDAMELQARDAELLAALRTGDDATLAQITLREHPQGPASGGPTLVAAARMLPAGYRGELCRQTSVPAPGDEPGVVGMAGMRLHAPAR
ncbi:AmmeMemoRadiSam system protein B [Paraliomyxa miuraensis]|uniref:AmmeMemoRadiSam system protein B n=1 Tax=Paraliomyxa miuraensis TaxID=376150 RepID=UPI002258352F|nr:AmmeMemoRadiSam system protein B [Paraliomyxa miuraensis]MCX4244647.1 AmmeMemoRadiSam system protein B [Paraliomyxa miuraensis]